MAEPEHERLMEAMSEETRVQYRHIMREIQVHMKGPGRRPTVREIVASGKVKVPAQVLGAIQGVMKRDESGPQPSETAADFLLKRLDSDEWVRLSDLWKAKPLGLVFGSYT